MSDFEGDRRVAQEFAEHFPDAIARLEKRIAELEADRETLKLEAQFQAGEARAHKSSLHEAYQYITGATGEPGNWNGARPIREVVGKLHDALTAERKRREECEAVLREVAGAPNRIAENARIIANYFSRYPLPRRLPMSENRESMIERVARALCSMQGSHPLNPDHIYKGRPIWQEWEHEARAAIEAMREPTPEMVEIGFVVERASENNPATYDDPISFVAYKAMIDTALGEDHP